MQLIPKVKMTDKATWVQSDVIALSATELLSHTTRLKTQKYFHDKKIILLSVMPDENLLVYSEILERINIKVDLKKLMLTSADCTCYHSEPVLCEGELELMKQENDELINLFDIEIGLLKGHNSATYYHIRDTLEFYVKSYMIYLTGEIRSNPARFDLIKWFQEYLPNGLDKPVYLHGCPKMRFKDLKELDLEIEGIITAGYITDAIYRGNPHYKRKTRIEKAWAQWLKYFEAFAK